MIPLGPVIARRRVSVSRTSAWRLLADAEQRQRWWPELELELRQGGTVRERWSAGEGGAATSRDASGTVDVLVDGHALGFQWSEPNDPRPTAVLLTLRSHDDATSLTVTETGFDALPEAAARATASQESWNLLLEEFERAAAEAGEALEAEVGEGETGAGETGEPDSTADGPTADTQDLVESAEPAEPAEPEISEPEPLEPAEPSEEAESPEEASAAAEDEQDGEPDQDGESEAQVDFDTLIRGD